MKNFSLAILISLALMGCASHQKKIILYASSDIQVDNSQKNITVTDGTTHHETELVFSGSDPVLLNVQSPTGKYTLEAKDDGLYIANLKTDTVVGSQQRVAEQTNNRISHEEFVHRVDSLQQLLVGKNVSAANKNYFILPGKIEKISSDTKGKVFGPYTAIPSSFDAGSVPELFKFYTNKEERDIISRLMPVINSSEPGTDQGETKPKK